MQWVWDNQQSQIVHVAICIRINKAHMNILFIIKVNILMLIKWSYRSPNIMLTIEPRIVSIFWACGPISFRHMMSFWCPLLNPHLTTYYPISSTLKEAFNIKYPNYQVAHHQGLTYDVSFKWIFNQFFGNWQWWWCCAVHETVARWRRQDAVVQCWQVWVGNACGGDEAELRNQPKHSEAGVVHLSLVLCHQLPVVLGPCCRLGLAPT